MGNACHTVNRALKETGAMVGTLNTYSNILLVTTDFCGDTLCQDPDRKPA